MKYISTRGGVRTLRSASFEDAVLTGYAEDGGLLMPEVIPKVSPEMMEAWSSMSYPQLVKEICKMYISQSEIPENDLTGLLDKAFRKFRTPEVCNVTRLKDGLNILEMFHGPTYAFKDLAMSCVGQFMEYFLNKSGKHFNILVGTSGDTGGAAIEAVRGLQHVDIIVLLPKGRCSRIQELQMTTSVDNNVHVFRVEGTSDDLDIPVKQCITDVEFARKHNLCSVNSICWCRVMVQIAHYFYSYFQVCSKVGETVQIVVPTGAGGNISGGVLAKQMGLPIDIVCVVNTNDIMARSLTAGDFSMSDNTAQTFASAMDIQIPYNMERLVYIASDGNTDAVRSFMEEFENNNKASIDKDILAKLQSLIPGTWVVGNEGIVKTMQKCWADNQYLLCPHTATAVHYHYQNPRSCPRVCLATASATKFDEVTQEAGLDPLPLTPDLQVLYTLPTRYSDMHQGQNWLNMLRQKIEEIAKSIAH